MSSRQSADKSVLALTFDDGPSPWTIEILDLLAEHGARATFFVLGASIEGREGTLRRAIAEGHQLGLHSWSHPHLPDLSPGEVRDEMFRTQAAIERATGSVARFWRPPYFEADEHVRRALAGTELIEVGCTIAPEDYHWSVLETAAYVIERLEPGAIVDLHDGRPEGSVSDPIRTATVAALELILSELDKRDLRSAPVSEFPLSALEKTSRS
jgi:peptidoglycan/xylan/chitin deacetylase (PgdA/CDA1 family)